MTMTTASEADAIDRPPNGGVAFLKKLTPVAGVLVFLTIWQIGVMVYQVPAYLLPAPTDDRAHLRR